MSKPLETTITGRIGSRQYEALIQWRPLTLIPAKGRGKNKTPAVRLWENEPPVSIQRDTTLGAVIVEDWRHDSTRRESQVLHPVQVTNPECKELEGGDYRVLARSDDQERIPEALLPVVGQDEFTGA